MILYLYKIWSFICYSIQKNRKNNNKKLCWILHHSSNIMQQIIIKKATCEAGLFDKKFYIISEKSWFQLEIHSQSWVTWYIKRWPIGCILSNWRQNPTPIQGQQIGTSRRGLEIKIQHFVCFLGNFTSVWKHSCFKVIFGKSGAGYSSPFPALSGSAIPTTCIWGHKTCQCNK